MGFDDASLESLGAWVRVFTTVGQNLFKSSYAGVEGDNTSQWPSKKIEVNQQIMRNVFPVNKLETKIMDSFRNNTKIKYPPRSIRIFSFL